MTPLFLAAAEHAGEHTGPVGPPQVIFSPFGLDVTSEITTEWAVVLIVAVLAFLATRNLRLLPGKVQVATETVVEFLIDGVIVPSIGSREKAIRYLPFLGTLFLFILFSNWTGLIPGAVLHIPGFKPPTSTLAVTAGLAIMVFFVTHYVGLKAKGIHYFSHFLQPYAWMLPLNIIEELIKPVSLALRLFGNIFGGETILWVLLFLVPAFVPLPIMGLELFFGLLQAFIFTTLAAVYIGTATAESH